MSSQSFNQVNDGFHKWLLAAVDKSAKAGPQESDRLKANIISQGGLLKAEIDAYADFRAQRGYDVHRIPTRQQLQLLFDGA